MCVCVCSIVSDSLWPHGLPSRLFCPWGSPVKNTGVGCHFHTYFVIIDKKRRSQQGKERWKWVPNKEADHPSHSFCPSPIPPKIDLSLPFPMTPPAWRNGLSAKSQKNKRKISLQKERAEGRDRSINKGWKDWPSECGIQEGVYFQNKSLQIRCFLTDEENGLSKSLCLGLETCPQWPEPLSQQEQLLFSWLWRQPLSKQGSSAGYPEAPGSLCLAWPPFPFCWVT